ncbi:Rv3235 family protein [Streptomyces sp. NPDC050418]|uniref:Rv3235 family protein n=1 Tax=Streptomyces sp. NPDC050418 TaxID=3365612 RepID=UPI0037B748FB
MSTSTTRPPSRRTTASRGPASRRDPRRPGESRRVPVQQRPTLPRYWFAERLLAVLSGHRPVHWMLNHTLGEAYDQLSLLAPRTPLSGRGTRPVIRDCGEHRPEDGVIEAFARIAAGGRLRAMAFRLEQGTDLRWKCTAIEVGTPA